MKSITIRSIVPPDINCDFQFIENTETGLRWVENGQYMCIVSFFCLKFSVSSHVRGIIVFLCRILHDVTGDCFTPQMSPETSGT